MNINVRVEADFKRDEKILKQIEPGLREGARMIYEDLYKRALKHIRTGTFISSLAYATHSFLSTQRSHGRGAKKDYVIEKPSGQYSAYVGSNAPHAHLIEEGAKYMRALQLLKKSKYAKKTEARDALRRAIAEVL